MHALLVLMCNFCETKMFVLNIFVTLVHCTKMATKMHVKHFHH